MRAPSREPRGIQGLLTGLPGALIKDYGEILLIFTNAQMRLEDQGASRERGLGSRDESSWDVGLEMKDEDLGARFNFQR